MVPSPGAESDAFAVGANLRQHDVDALLVDRAKGGIGKPQTDPAILALDPEAALLQIGQKAPLRAVVRVGNVIAHHRGLTCDLTDSSHCSLLRTREAAARVLQQSHELSPFSPRF